MTISCAIIDDEPLALNLLESYVAKTPFLHLAGKYSSAIQALKELPSHPVQLLFLDIQMPELSGMEFSKMVDNRTRIIFTTAFEQYALDGYRVNALDYLLKPISYSDFLTAANKALQWFMLSERTKEDEVQLTTPLEAIYVKSEYRLIQVLLKDILYIEGMKDYIKIYTQHEPKPILSLMTMKAIEELLPPDAFMRIHRSYIVQKQMIKVIDRNRIVFGKEYIPIGDSYKDELARFLKGKSV